MKTMEEYIIARVEKLEEDSKKLHILQKALNDCYVRINTWAGENNLYININSVDESNKNFLELIDILGLKKQYSKTLQEREALNNEEKEASA